MRRVCWILVLLQIAFACRKEADYDFPLIFTGEVTGIDSTGAVFHGKITGLGSESFVEYGFVWDSRSDPLVESAEKLVVRQSPETGTFQQRISTTLEEGTTYYVRAFIKTDRFITYGKEVTFTSLGSVAPVIISVTPNPANIGDTVTIAGQNFSYRLTGNRIWFNEFQAAVVKGNQDTLWVIVPDALDTVFSIVSVSILGNKGLAVEPFQLVAPVIVDFYPGSGTFGSLVTVSGLNFLSHPASFRAWVGDLEAGIIEHQDDRLVIEIPDSLNHRQVNIRLGMNNLTISSVELFRLESFTLSDFAPQIALTGESILITGNNFSPLAGHNTVTIGGLDATVTEASLEELSVILPLQKNGFYDSRDNTIRVEVIGESHEFGEKIHINDRWFRLHDSPIIYNDAGYVSTLPSIQRFVVNHKAYIGLNGTVNFWEFDPATDEWVERAAFPGIPRFLGTGFEVDDKIYFGTGYSDNGNLNDWWEYDITQDLWTQKSNFGGGGRAGAVAFQWGNNGYVGTGVTWGSIWGEDFTDIWLYITELNSWTKATDYPVDPNYYQSMWFGIAITGNQSAYIGLGTSEIDEYQHRIFKYFPTTNLWERIADYPHAAANNFPIGFKLMGKIYIKTQHTNHFYGYDEATNTWELLKTDILTDVSKGIAFSIGTKAYVGLGRDKAMWEYDPLR